MIWTLRLKQKGQITAIQNMITAIWFLNSTEWRDIIYLINEKCSSYLQITGCWAADECGHQRELSERQRDGGPHAARPLSRCARLSRDASGCRSEQRASQPSPQKDRFPRRTRRRLDSALERETNLIDVHHHPGRLIFHWCFNPVNKTQLFKRNETW